MSGLKILESLAADYAAGKVRDLVFEIQYRLGVGVAEAQQLATVITGLAPTVGHADGDGIWR